MYAPWDFADGRKAICVCVQQVDKEFFSTQGAGHSDVRWLSRIEPDCLDPLSVAVFTQRSMSQYRPYVIKDEPQRSTSG